MDEHPNALPHHMRQNGHEFLAASLGKTLPCWKTRARVHQSHLDGSSTKTPSHVSSSRAARSSCPSRPRRSAAAEVPREPRGTRVAALRPASRRKRLRPASIPASRWFSRPHPPRERNELRRARSARVRSLRAHAADATRISRSGRWSRAHHDVWSMANVAAHLVDRVLPAVPIRQWVLSLPFELRRRRSPRDRRTTTAGASFESHPGGRGGGAYAPLALAAPAALGPALRLVADTLAEVRRRLRRLASTPIATVASPADAPR
jgi:hypothetical protein